MLVSWLPGTANTIPANATHRVGIGAFVVNERNEVCFGVTPCIFVLNVNELVNFQITEVLIEGTIVPKTKAEDRKIEEDSQSRQKL